MIHIDFYGGLHGHFLEYSINALVDDIKKINPFTVYGTSHANFSKPLAIANHYSSFNWPIGENIINIVANEEDCLLVNLLNLSRGGDHNFNLNMFEKNFGSAVRNTSFYIGFRESLLHYGIDIAETDSIPRGVLRESLKYNFYDPKKNSFMQHVYNMKYLDQGLNIHFRSFYDNTQYIEMLEKIVKHFDLSYKVDVAWYLELIKKFKGKLICLDQEQDSFCILQDVINLVNKPINFNIVQEAWLNAEIENRYGIEMPFNQEQYFLTTNDINQYLKRL